MAKVKTFAVDVEYTVRRTLFVEARRPNGAAEKALSREGWAEAVRYDDDAPAYPPKGAAVVRVRQA